MLMKRFVFEVFLFGLLTLAVLGAGEIYIRQLPNPARDKHEWMLKHAPEVETLVLGSSHTFYGVNPAFLGPNAYSLAMVSQTYRYDDWLLRNYDFKRLKRIILPFSYFSFYEDYETGVGDNYISRYRIYMDCPIHRFWSKYNLEVMDFPSYKEKLKSLYQPQRMTWDERGWGSNYRWSERRDDWDNGEVRALANTYTDTSAVALNVDFLSDILEWGRAHQVEILLVTTPLSEKYRRAMDKAQIVRNHHLLNSLLTQFPEVIYLDYSSDPSFISDDFFDSDHLSDRGAEKLTKILAQRLD